MAEKTPFFGVKKTFKSGARTMRAFDKTLFGSVKATIKDLKQNAMLAFCLPEYLDKVCIFDETGKVWLYLRRNEDGTVHVEEA